MTIPQEAIDAAERILFELDTHTVTTALEAAAPHIAAAERERIRQLAEALKFTLFRPGRGTSPAHAQALEVVPLSELADLLTEGDTT